MILYHNDTGKHGNKLGNKKKGFLWSHKTHKRISNEKQNVFFQN